MELEKRFKNHDFFKTTISICSEYNKRLKVNGENEELTNFEIYNFRILFSADNILVCLDQLFYSIEMLSGFKRKPNSEMNRHAYIVFMLENFYIRISSIFDRVLRFTNVVFELGLEEQNCTLQKIKNNDKIKDTPIYSILENLNTFIKKYRDLRNVIAHSSSYSEDQLDYIQMYYIYFESKKEELENPQDFELTKKIAKLDTDSFVINKKIELKEIANGLELLLIEFLNEIAHFSVAIGQKYKNS